MRRIRDLQRQHGLLLHIPENYPRVDEEDDQGAAGDREAADDDVVHGHRQKVVHEMHVLRETVQDPVQMRGCMSR